MIVRDPFERLVSAYRNKFQNKTAINYTMDTIPDKSFMKRMQNNRKRIIEKYRYNYTRTVEAEDSVSFIEYVRHLIDTPPWEVNEHWMPYEDLCRPCNVNYDFIGSVDTLERDVTHVMRQIYANETKYRVVYTGDVLTKTKQTTVRFLKGLSQKYFDQLLAIHKTDFELFGYPVPQYKTLHKHYQVLKSTG